LPTFIVLVLALAALGLWAWSFAGNKDAKAPSTQDTAGPGAAPVGSDTIRAMTVNVRFSEPEDGENAWPNRRDFLVKTVLKYGPDIVGCQEVLPAQGAFLVKEFGKWYSHFPRPGVGKPAAEEEKSVSGELLDAMKQSVASLNTLFYRSDRFDCIDGEAGLVFPGELQRDPAENTFYALAVLKEKEGGRIYIAVNTHLRHQEAFAIRCAIKIREKIGATLKTYPDAKVVLMGDMNHDSRGKVYAALVGVSDGAGILADSFDYSKKRPNESWGNWHAFKGKPQRDLPTDLIFTGGRGLKSKGAAFIRDKDERGRYPSDHFFVVADLVAK
jgi:endonuclease/exonuclease/phosphatase family metal-dependent hydrolase